MEPGISRKGMLPCMAGAGLIAFCLPAFIERARKTRKGVSSPLLERGRVLEILPPPPKNPAPAIKTSS